MANPTSAALDRIRDKAQKTTEEAKADNLVSRRKKQARRSFSSQIVYDVVEEKTIRSDKIMSCYFEQARHHDMMVTKWDKKEMAIAKRFISKVGSEELALRVVEYIFEHWQELSKKWRMEEGSTPTINMISTFGLSLVNVVGKQENTNELKIGLGTKAIRSITGGKNE